MRSGLRAYGLRRWLVQLALLFAIGGVAASPAAAQERLVVAFGDSLMAGYGLPGPQGFAPRLQAALKARGVTARVRNAGVSGDTSAAGRARLGWVLNAIKVKPALVIVELGANDMLRGLPPAQTRANLDAILAELKRRGIPAMLAGMRAAPNLGAPYRTAFDGIYPTLARKYAVPLYPFFLAGVTGQRTLVLPDGLHPNAQGVERVAQGIAPMVVRALR